MPLSNRVVDSADQFIIVPKNVGPAWSLGDLSYLNRLDEVSSPFQRLKILFVSAIDPTQSTYEGEFLKSMTIGSFFGGLFFSGVVQSRDIHEDYVRKHNADVFRSQYRGNRHFWDTLVVRVVSRGLRSGLITSCVVTSVGAISLGSLSYRSRLYLPDWLVGFAAIGGLSRLWLGPRAVMAGALIGSVAGLSCFGLSYSLAAITGFDVSRFRYMNHMEYVERNEARLRRLQIAKEKDHKHYIDMVMSGQNL